MIKRTTIFASLFLALVAGGVIFASFCSSNEVKNIEEVLTEEIAMPKQEEKYPNKQMRSGVSKDLWISEKGEKRLHHHIESPRSILTAIPHKNRIELVEQMVGMKCYFQEKIEQENGEMVQTIRYIESEEGTYRYTDHNFDAHSVFLALYRAPGESLTTQLNTKDAYLKGVAEEVTLSLSEGSPNFHAEKFKAQIRPQGSIQ